MQNTSNKKDTFSPKGSIAFFILLLILCAAIWFGVYYSQLNKA